MRVPFPAYIVNSRDRVINQQLTNSRPSKGMKIGPIFLVVRLSQDLWTTTLSVTILTISIEDFIFKTIKFFNLNNLTE